MRVLIAALALLVAGCAGPSREGRAVPVRRVEVPVLHAGPVDLLDPGVRTLGVLPFTGPGGEVIASDLAAQLEEDATFRTLGPAAAGERLMQAGLSVGWAPSRSSLQWVHERVGMDGVVVGRVEAFRVEGSDEAKEALIPGGTGEYHFVRNEEGKLAYRERTEYRSVPFFCRSDGGRVAASYRVWDLHRGEEIATVRHQLSAEMASFCYRGDVPEPLARQARDRLLQRLFRDLNGKFLADVLPRAERVAVELEVIRDAGATVARRNELAILSASRGRWDRARDLWRDCLGERPDLPGIHYNLAVAYRAEGRVSLARDHLRRAMALAPRRLYQEALDAIGRRGS